MSRVAQRVEEWKRKIVDLSRRNRSLYFARTRASTLKITEPAISEIFDRLVTSEKRWGFFMPPDASEASAEAGATLTEGRALDEGPDARLGDGEKEAFATRGSADVVTDVGDGARLRAILRNLYRRSRTDFEERGVRILFLTFGMLEWNEVYESETIKSPILLVPVELKRESVNDPFELWPVDEDIVVNPALAVKLADDFKVEMPSVPDDWDSTPLDQFLSNFRDHTAKYGWTVTGECWLGLFSFHKLVIYHDLKDHGGLLEAHSVVRRLCEDGDGATGVEPPDPRELDEKTSPSTSFLIADADSSQLVCIEAVKAGSNLVVQGPPGTGKSQTITNLIAEFIARGKSVLFVSEKMAALEVVFRRLHNAGMGHFCLQLHSHKANKREVIRELYRTHSGQLRPKRGLTDFEAKQLMERRRQLNDYVRSLHLVRQPLGWSVFNVLSWMAQLAGVDYVPIGSFDASGLTPESLDQADQIAKQLQPVWPVAAGGERFPWFGCTVTTFSLSIKAQLAADLHECLSSVAALGDSGGHLAQLLGLETPSNISDAHWLLETAALVCACPGIERQWLFGSNLQEITTEAERYQSLTMEYREGVRILESLYTTDFMSLPADFRERLEGAVGNLTGLVGRPLSSDPAFVADRALLRQWSRGFFSRIKHWLGDGGVLQDALALGGRVTLARLRQLVRVAQLCESEDRPDRTWFELTKLRNVGQSLSQIREDFQSRNRARRALLSEYEMGVLDLDCKELIEKFSGPYSSVLRIFRPSYYRSKRQIRVLRRDGSLPRSVLGDLRKVQNLKDTEARLQAEFPRYEELLGAHFRGFETDFERVARALCNAQELVRLAEEQPLPDRFIRQASAQGLPTRELRESAERIRESIEDWEETLPQVARYLPADFGNDARTRIEERTLEEVESWSGRLAAEAEEVCRLMDVVVAATLSSDGFTCEQAITDLGRLIKVHAIENDMVVESGRLRARFGNFFVGVETAWDRVLEALQWTSTFTAHMGQRQLSEALVDVIVGGKEGAPGVDAMANDLKRVLSAIERLGRNFADRFPAIDGRPFAEAEFAEVAPRLREMLDQIEVLREWVDFKVLEADFRGCGLGEFLASLVSRATSISSDEIPNILRKSMLQAWLDGVFSADRCLGAFRGENHERLISEFRELDRKHWEQGVHRVIREINRHHPAASVVIPGGELGVLLREAHKQRRHLPLRKLFGLIPNLLTQLKPCLLMSPISVSQFLDPGKMRFDLVIFDEASQLRSEDAICSIYRGKQLVVCGDDKQLPPTTFFEQGMSDDLPDDSDDPSAMGAFDVFDSILDACAAVMPQRQLKWHYRSEHESLIAFSNSMFYDYSLVTFPSSLQEDESLGVKLLYVPDGVYDRGGRRDNVREAERVVGLVQDHLRRRPNQSLGIVTFSISQADTIENRLEQFRRENPDVEQYFSPDRFEKVFVKNLESVQGDERDVLIFSVGYGKDAFGRLTMNFGPLNGAGGERRLNVAVTRARKMVIVVSSVRASDFDLAAINREGVRVLHRYLDFAERGPDALALRIGEGEFESPFERSVASKIRSFGFAVVPQVGCSSFRVDLGVVDPSRPGRFVLGVECDGASYHSSATARDRDRIRQQILERLGWKIHRIWSPDWVSRNEVELSRLRRAIETALEGRGEGPSSPPTQMPGGGFLGDGPIVIEKDISGIEEKFSIPSWVETYRVCALRAPRARGLQFHDADALPVLKRMLYQIVNAEAPIHKDVAAVRLARAWELERVGERMMKAVKFAWRSLSREKLLRIQGEFLWPVTETFQVSVRRPDPENDQSRRLVDEIPREEIALAMRNLTRDCLSIERDKLLQYVARIFGFERTGANIERALESTFAQLLESRQLVLLEDRVSLPN